MRPILWIPLVAFLALATLPWACSSTPAPTTPPAPPTATFTPAITSTVTATGTVTATSTATTSPTNTGTPTRTPTPTVTFTSTFTATTSVTATPTATLETPLASWNAQDGGSSGPGPGYIAVNSAGTSVYLSYNYYTYEASDYDLIVWTAPALSNTYSQSLSVVAKNPSTSFSAYPAGLAVDSSGNVYVDDPGSSVLEYNYQLSGAATIIPNSVTASAPGTLYLPYSVAVDGSNKLYVAENSTTYTLQAFSASPGFSPLFHAALSGATAYTAVAANSAGSSIFCAPIHNPGSDITVFNSSGVSIATYGASLPNFSVGGLAVAQGGPNAGNLYVTDIAKDRVMEFDTSAALVASWGVSVSGTGFQSPSGIAVDGSGNIYVADYLNGQVQKFAPQ